MRARRIYENEDISVVASTLEELDKITGEVVLNCLSDVDDLPDGDYDAHIKGWDAVIEHPNNPDKKFRVEMDGHANGKDKGIVMVRNGSATILIK